MNEIVRRFLTSAWSVLLIPALPCMLYAQGAREEMVDVGGHKLHAILMGTGPQTVILEGGGSDPAAKKWAKVQPDVARFARVLACDRAGNGASPS